MGTWGHCVPRAFQKRGDRGPTAPRRELGCAPGAAGACGTAEASTVWTPCPSAAHVPASACGAPRGRGRVHLSPRQHFWDLL